MMRFLRARDFQAEAVRVAGVVQDLGGIEKRLGRHAATQDTEAAELPGPVDDGDPLTEPGSHTRRVEAGATAADADEVVGLGLGHGV